MRIKWILLPILGAISACSGLGDGRYIVTSPQNVVTITKVSGRPPFGPGTLAVWVRVDATDSQGIEKTYYRSYAGNREPMIKKGLKCRVFSHIGYIDGFISESTTGQPIRDANIIDEFFCW